MQHRALICGQKNTSNQHKLCLQISALACCPPCASSAEDIFGTDIYIQFSYCYFFFLLVLNSKCNAVTRASKSRGRLESRHHLLQKLRAIGETGSLNSYLCLCPLSALCNQINLNKTGGKLMHWSSAQSIVWFTHYCTAAEGHISSHCSEPNWELKPLRTKKYSTWKNAIFQIVFSSFKLFNMVTQTLGKKWN